MCGSSTAEHHSESSARLEGRATVFELGWPGGYGLPMRPEIVDALALAIRERRPVRLEYRYRGQGLRLVHPHALYASSRGLLCDVYQVSGYTSEGKTLPGWRALEVACVVSAETESGRFALAPGYNPASARYQGGLVASD